MKVTAETITDEQLRRIVQDAERTIGDARFALLRINGPTGDPSPATAIALQRCAEAWNGGLGIRIEIDQIEREIKNKRGSDAR